MPAKKTEFEKLFPEGKKGGRRPLPPEEKERRQKLQKIKTRRNQQAKARAYAVLAHRHADEFEDLFQVEFDGLAGDPRFDASLHD